MENSVRRVLVDEFKKTLNSTDEFKESSQLVLRMNEKK